MRPRELGALIFSAAGLFGLVIIAIIQTFHDSKPQPEVLIALTAVTAGAAQWLFRNGNGRPAK